MLEELNIFKSSNFRDSNGLVYFEPYHQPPTTDKELIGVLFACGVIGIALFVAAISRRGKRRWSTVLRALYLAAIFTIIMGVFVFIRAGYWSVGYAALSCTYRAFSPGTIDASIGVRLGLRHMNITLSGSTNTSGTPGPIMYNEVYRVDTTLHLRKDLADSLRCGVPYAVHQVAEQVHADFGLSGLGRHFKLGGRFCTVLLVTALFTWILVAIFSCIHMLHTIAAMALTSISLLAASLIQFLYVPYSKFIVHFDRGDITLKLGWTFYLVAATGVINLLFSLILYVVNIYRPETTADYFMIRTSAPVVEHRCLKDKEPVPDGQLPPMPSRLQKVCGLKTFGSSFDVEKQATEIPCVSANGPEEHVVESCAEQETDKLAQDDPNHLTVDYLGFGVSRSGSQRSQESRASNTSKGSKTSKASKTSKGSKTSKSSRISNSSKGSRGSKASRASKSCLKKPVSRGPSDLSDVSGSTLHTNVSAAQAGAGSVCTESPPPGPRQARTRSGHILSPETLTPTPDRLDGPGACARRRAAIQARLAMEEEDQLIGGGGHVTADDALDYRSDSHLLQGGLGTSSEQGYTLTRRSPRIRSELQVFLTSPSIEGLPQFVWDEQDEQAAAGHDSSLQWAPGDVGPGGQPSGSAPVQRRTVGFCNVVFNMDERARPLSLELKDSSGLAGVADTTTAGSAVLERDGADDTTEGGGNRQDEVTLVERF